MIELRLDRIWLSERACEGELFVDGEHFCWTIEDRSRGLAWHMSLAEILRRKVYGQTAIPIGRYRVVLYNSPKHGPDTLLLVDVPGFDFIEIHIANRAEELQGCIAVGTDQTTPDDDWVGGSRAALTSLRERIVPRMKAGEACWIVVTETEAA